jgi:cytochrome c oxidase subunit 1
MAVAAVHSGGIADHIHPEPQGFVRRYVFSLDHKIIGIQYIITAFVFFMLSGLLAEAIRTQLLNPNGGFVAPGTYNEVYSVHGSAMVWLVIIPLLTGGFGNLVFPLQIGARDVAFPWLNMLSFWIFPVAGLMLFSSFLMGAPTAGWMEYPPVSLQGAAGTSMWCAAIFLVGVSSTMTGINFVVTILKMRAPGMTFTRMPLFVWGQFATAPLLMIATTALAAALAALFIERQFGVPFYDPTRGGSPVMWQHMFWFYSHPAVYIMILPAFGIISEVLPTFARKPVFGYKLIAFSSMAIALAGFMVWAHHMFTSGLAPFLQLPFMIITYLIGVPTGIKIFSWTATLWGGKIHYSTAMLFAIGFVGLFTLGGITGIFLAAIPFDLARTRDVFYRRAPPLRARWRESHGRLCRHVLLVPQDVGPAAQRNARQDPLLALLHRFQLHVSSDALAGNARDAARGSHLRSAVHVLEPLRVGFASYLMTFAILIFFVNVLWSIRNGRRSGPNPWGARTLEWQIPSPPHYYNFKHIPTVYGLPYDFSQPLPYKGLEEELTDSPPPVAAGAH